MKAVEAEEMEDIEAILEENPPLPEEEFPVVQQPKKVRVVAGPAIELQEQRGEGDEEIVL